MTATLRLLAKDEEPHPSIVCLDANALLDVYQHEEASRGNKALRKHPELIAFLSRMGRKKIPVFLTPQVIEEVFHVLLKRLLRPQMQGRGIQDEKRFRDKHPSDYAKEREIAIKGITRAVSDAKKHGVRVCFPTGTTADVRMESGENLYQVFLGLLQAVPQLGGKDALHIGTARLLECDHFVSADGDFRHVTDLTVFVESIPSGWAQPATSTPAKTPPPQGPAPGKATK